MNVSIKRQGRKISERIGGDTACLQKGVGGLSTPILSLHRYVSMPLPLFRSSSIRPSSIYLIFIHSGSIYPIPISFISIHSSSIYPNPIYPILSSSFLPTLYLFIPFLLLPFLFLLVSLSISNHRGMSRDKG